MKPAMKHLDALIIAAKELKKAQQSFEKKSAKARDVDLSMRQRAIGKANADMHWDALHVEKCWDSLHACAVNLGLCEALEPDAYEPRDVQWSGMHSQRYQPTRPDPQQASAQGEQAQQASAQPTQAAKDDKATPGPWFVRKLERGGELVDCFVAAPDRNGFAYDAEILGDDEYRDGIERKLADCELIVAAVNSYRASNTGQGD